MVGTDFSVFHLRSRTCRLPRLPSLMFLDRSRQGPPRGMGTLASALVFVQALKTQCPCLIKPL